MDEGRVTEPGEQGGRHTASRGYILVMLLGFITVMGILLMVALPNVTTEVQRDQEAELIFRGEAIAQAIRAYKAKTGTYPLNLEDLEKIRPRIIRKLYLDPMTRQGGHEGEWDLITAVQAGASGDKTGLPIVGVRSYCQKDSIKTYMDKTLISDWTFSAADNLLGVPGANAAAAALGVAAPGTAQPAKPAEGVDLANLPQGIQNPAPPNPAPQNPAPQNPAPQAPAPPAETAPANPPSDSGAQQPAAAPPAQPGNPSNQAGGQPAPPPAPGVTPQTPAPSN